MFAFAIKRGWAQSNPVAYVDRPKKTAPAPTRPIPTATRTGQADRRGAGGHPRRRRRALYLAAALTGLRQGELLALRWLDIDWQVGRVRVADNFTRGQMDTPKSHEGRSVPMAARLARELDELRRRSRFPQTGIFVFCHPDTGHVLDPSKMRKRFKDALAEAGVHEITFHELRHTFGTQMAAAGAPLRAIQEWMGHADAKTAESTATTRPIPPTEPRSSNGHLGTADPGESTQAIGTLRSQMPDPPAHRSAETPESPRSYEEFLEDIKARIRSAQARAARAINAELIDVYWQIGQEILRRQGEEGNRRGRGGPKIIERLSVDLRAAFPGARGFL